ncbi:unnamed protein product [Bemisia tabaci]|uniref:Uncharacterized protein n=1 Tax=Bemisia tabaci TaxID=7038 RepID=A0A9P0AAC0_BEMTA|nr:unnamed protein product [Bemisia tabaci]
MACKIFLLGIIGVAASTTHRKVMIRMPKQMKNTEMKEAMSNDPQMPTMSQPKDQSPEQSRVAVGNEDTGKGNGKGEYFMDVYSLETGPEQLEFGHVLEDPNEWEQRYERKDHENNRFQGKVRWGDKRGSYGEHYWDFNHGGHDKEQPEMASESQKEPQMMKMSETKRSHDHAMPQPPTKNHRMNQRAATVKPDVNERVKRHKKIQLPKLVFDTETWTVIDENTDQHFFLQPIVNP